ncbi:ABC transporter ATP-binding protein [Prosthecomicrobium sp. N25]|uniref:ABC transporter ATP-binding protein n=1 Tax=Prosthecomicrobium sp. N25 TaxID=3129254 RepID=UPI003078A238
MTVTFRSRERTVHAVNGVSFALKRGEVLGILGESGSGKSVTLRALMRLLPGHAEVGGKVVVAGRDVATLSEQSLEDVRGRSISMIFQEPMTALDPVFTIGEQIAETVRRHEGCDRRSAEARALELLELVQIPSARRRLKAYPHEMSGGMRQRAMIALALSCRPSVLLADEPTTALDVTVQIQILLLLRKLQKELGMAVIFVTHDVGAAVEVSDRLAVMYAGRFVETGTSLELIEGHRHPYTKGLLDSMLHGDRRGQRLETIPGAPPSLGAAPSGCSFAPRCKWAKPSCSLTLPDPTAFSDTHMARCFRMDPSAPGFAMKADA